MPFLDKVDEWVADAAFVLFLAGVDFHAPFEALFESLGCLTVIFGITLFPAARVQLNVISACCPVNASHCGQL
ncbi:Uncharacterised protein [Klebsiella pneumoniae]|nr:Uncharacterised protein [Klebsiella pneumoniae]SVM48910.1 Uncharacterised protein [Klebsiella pneumoniae]